MPAAKDICNPWKLAPNVTSSIPCKTTASKSKGVTEVHIMVGETNIGVRPTISTSSSHTNKLNFSNKLSLVTNN